MKANQKPNLLAHAIRDFFTNHLSILRGMSLHTIHSYRDCLGLLLRFVASKKKRSVVQLDIEDLNVENVIAFLQMLEKMRHNSIKTRNVRLAAIHVFFRYLAGKYPVKLEQCQQVLAVPFKRAQTIQTEYFEYDEIQAILGAIDRSTEDGKRDYILLVTMFNTGARVQEILDIRWCDLQLIKPYQSRIIGKGRKERICPLWPETVLLLQELLKEAGSAQREDRVFLNHRKQPLTRFGVRYILNKYCILAKENMPSLICKRLHPHSIRHSTAIHLLKSGVDIVTVSHLLGHSSINTTNRYLNIDLEMKRQAIQKITLTDNPEIIGSWNADTNILTWLESL